MRSTLQRRITSLLAIVAFAATGAADAYGLHSCPHHDALPAVTAQAGVSVVPAGAHGSTDAPAHDVSGTPVRHGMAGQHAAHALDSTGTSSEHADHGPCNCVGACSANPPAAPLETAHVTIAAPLSTSTAVVRAQVQPHPRSTPYLLPWANAPPFSASR